MADSRKFLVFEPDRPTVAPDPASAEPALAIGSDAASALAELVRIIEACGQNPVTQLSGYLITEDPTYLPEEDHARFLAAHIGRDKLLETLIELYMETCATPAPPESDV